MTSPPQAHIKQQAQALRSRLLSSKRGDCPAGSQHHLQNHSQLLLTCPQRSSPGPRSPFVRVSQHKRHQQSVVLLPALHPYRQQQEHLRLRKQGLQAHHQQQQHPTQQGQGAQAIRGSMRAPKQAWLLSCSSRAHTALWCWHQQQQWQR